MDSISVIIPIFNEDRWIPILLKALEKESTAIEIIIVDGGSSDQSLLVTKSFPNVKIANASRGRASQMNAGAAIATGEILFFLHVDSQLPANAFDSIRNSLLNPKVSAGSFCLAFYPNHLILRFFAFFTRINSVFFTYGDQGLFLRKETFNKIGGFANLPIMEDVEIQQRLRKEGHFIKINDPIISSSRRYFSAGIILQQAVNTILVLLFWIGIPPAMLKRFYK